MFDRDLWAEIFHSIKMNKLRTFLTGFSVAWGIFILVILLASVNGMKNGFLSEFNDDATNAIFISTSSTTKPYGGFKAGRKIRLKNKDLDYIKGNFEDQIEYITPRYRSGFTVKYKKETGTYSVRGVAPSHKITEKTIIEKGRYLTNVDIEKKQKVVVIGKKIREDLFGSENPIGKTVLMNSSPFKVIGIFSDKGNEREERMMYIPISTLQQLYGNTDHLTQIVLTYDPKMSLAEAKSFAGVIETVLKRNHKVAPDDQGAIDIDHNIEEFSDINNFTGMLNMVSVGVGTLILLAGIIGIANILVFIIKERTKEIGIRKALGARPMQVVNLVLMESVFITAISGFVGMFFAMLLVNLVSPSIETSAFSHPKVELSTVIIATVILIVAGILAGLTPAIKASRVKPIVALRAD